METKVMAAGALGAGVGVLQTVILREEVDKKYPLTNVAALKGWGTPSALAGIITGTFGLIVGVYGAGKGKDGRQRLADIYNEPAIDYGAAALVGGLLSGWKPAVTAADCAAAGGFYYNGACHKTAQTGTVSMEPQVQTAAYRAPLNPSYNVQGPDMAAVRQMSAEIQRLGQAVNALSQENAQLKAMSPAITVMPLEPGTVSSKQRQYGFMDPATNTMIAPGQPTARAKQFGFMDSGTPIAKVQTMKDRFGFSG